MLKSFDPTLLFVGLGVSAMAAYPIFRLLIHLKSRQTVSQYAPKGHQQKQGTPTMGGLIILAGFLSVLAMGATGPAPLAAVMGFALIGFIDDFVVPRVFEGKRGLGWKQKILMQFVVAGIVGWLFAGGANLIWFAASAFLILFFANAYNFADGLDGLAGGLIVALCIGLVLFLPANDSYALAALGLLGATIPFLFINAPPAKVFMGDVGSMPIGAFLGLAYAHILSEATTGEFVLNWVTFAGLFIMNIVLILELVLVPIQVGYYKRTKKRIFPATPIHHGFEVKGWPESRVVWSFILAQAVFIILASPFFAPKTVPTTGLPLEQVLNQ